MKHPISTPTSSGHSLEPAELDRTLHAIDQRLRTLVLLMFERDGAAKPSSSSSSSSNDESQLPRLSRLQESVEYSLLAPGKRIRPRLTLAVAKLVGLPQDIAITAGAVIEMIHCFTLIHDDLPCMDNDDYRRGRLSNHKVFGEATALLAGDALFSIAVESFLEIPFGADRAVTAASFKRALALVLGAIGPKGAIGGQARELETSAATDAHELTILHDLKTGALFRAAVLVPAVLNGSPYGQPAEVKKVVPSFLQKGRDYLFAEIRSSTNDPAFDALDHYSRVLGRAFQVADDLADRLNDKGTKNLTAHAELTSVPLDARRALEQALLSLVPHFPRARQELGAITESVMRSLEEHTVHG